MLCCVVFCFVVLLLLCVWVFSVLVSLFFVSVCWARFLFLRFMYVLFSVFVLVALFPCLFSFFVFAVLDHAKLVASKTLLSQRSDSDLKVCRPTRTSYPLVVCTSSKYVYILKYILATFSHGYLKSPSIHQVYRKGQRGVGWEFIHFALRVTR